MTNQLKEALVNYFGKELIGTTDERRNAKYLLCRALDAEPVTERPTDKQPGTPEFVLLPCPFCGVTPQKSELGNNVVYHPGNKCVLSGMAVPLDKWRYRARIVVDGHVICEGTESLRGQWDKGRCKSECEEVKR